MSPSPVPAAPPSPPRIAVVTCAVMEEDIAALSRGLSHIVHVEVVEQGLHEEPDKLRHHLQATIDRVEASVDAAAIVLGYGLCSRGIEGVRTTRCRLVAARAHDCITLLLGDKDRYARYVAENPGTYWYSTGWNRHALMPGKERYEKLLNKYLEKYGPDNAEFLMESEQHWFKTYNRATFVELTIGKTDGAVAYTKQCANWLGWQFDHQQGDPDLMRSLLEGRWDEARFVVLEPGQVFRMTADDRVIEAAAAKDGAP